MSGDNGGKRISHLRPVRDLSQPSRALTQPQTTADGPSAANGDAPAGDAGLAISEAMVGLLRARTGTRPAHARTEISSNLATVTLSDCLTTAEKTLARDGDWALTRQFRAGLYEGMRVDAIAAVEEITGKEVAAYLANQELDPDRSIIAFLFGPSAGGERI